MAGSNIIGASGIAPKILHSAQLGTADAARYTVPADQSVKIATATLCNTTTSPVEVNLSLVPTGGSTGAAHRFVSSYDLGAHDSLSLSDLIGGAMLGPGDFIAGFAGSANAVSLVITGTVHS